MQFSITKPYSDTQQMTASCAIVDNFENIMLSKDHVPYDSTDNKCAESIGVEEAESAIGALWGAESICCCTGDIGRL